MITICCYYLVIQETRESGTMSLPVGIAIELGQVAQVANSAIGERIQYTQDTSY